MDEKSPENKWIDEMNKKREMEFLECMGNGKPIHQLEEENDLVEEELIAGNKKWELNN